MRVSTDERKETRGKPEGASAGSTALSIEASFDEAAAGYDRARRQLVPGLEGFYGAALESIPFGRDAEIRVLDLGAGTGLLSAMVAERLSSLAGDARRPLGGDAPGGAAAHARRRTDASSSAPWTTRASRCPRAGTTSSSRRSRSTTSRTGTRGRSSSGSDDSLVVGGYFVNADQVLGETEEEEEGYNEWWLRRVREAGVSEEDLGAALARMRADRNATLRAQLGWLEDVGFEGIRCAYADHRFAVYGGRKGPTNSGKGKESDG